jgi:3-methylcrotonyl-CoA carboxylase alpha subunit
VAFQRNADGESFHDPAPVRIDAGFGEGDAITPHYDSMIAKLIVWGDDRAQALARLDAALAQTHIVGVQTNVAFLRKVVTSRAFATADLDTALIERERAALFEAPPLPLRCIVGGVVAHALALERRRETADPWARADGWRLHGASTRRFDIEVHGTHHPVTLERLHGGALWLAVGASRWAFSATPRGADRHEVTVDGRRWSLAVYADGEQVAVFAPEGSGVAHEVDLIAHAGDSATEGGRLTAPMPGKVIAFLAKAGDTVKLGQPLAVMEAMKMEHTITAPRDGTIEELLYSAGDQVDEGGELLRLVSA